MLAPGSWITAGGIAALAVTFALAASLALYRGLHLECACFGSSSSAPLGWRQLAMAPMWLALAASLMLVPPAFGGQRLPLTFAVVAVIATGVVIRLSPLLREHRAQRQAIEAA